MLMAVMNKQQANDFTKMDDFFLDLLNLLEKQKVIDDKEHRKFLLTGYDKLIEHLENNNIISSKDAKDAMEKGFTSLVHALAK